MPPRRRQEGTSLIPCTPRARGSSAAGAGRWPVFPCRVTGNVPIPTALPEVAWRRGLDLNPIDLRSAEEVAWLETLVWPGQEARAERLRAAIAIACADPPPMVQGDLLTDLEPLMCKQPVLAARMQTSHHACLGADRDGGAAMSAWYYAASNQTVGPVEADDIRRLLSTGQV